MEQLFTPGENCSQSVRNAVEISFSYLFEVGQLKGKQIMLIGPVIIATEYSSGNKTIQYVGHHLAKTWPFNLKRCTQDVLNCCKLYQTAYFPAIFLQQKLDNCRLIGPAFMIFPKHFVHAHTNLKLVVTKWHTDNNTFPHWTWHNTSVCFKKKSRKFLSEQSSGSPKQSVVCWQPVNEFFATRTLQSTSHGHLGCSVWNFRGGGCLCQQQWQRWRRLILQQTTSASWKKEVLTEQESYKLLSESTWVFTSMHSPDNRETLQVTRFVQMQTWLVRKICVRHVEREK